MNKKDMLYYFLSSAKTSQKRIKVTGGEKTVVKGYVKDLKREDDLMTVVLEDATYVIDFATCDVRTGIFDSRTILVDGDVPLKFQLW